MDIPNIYDLTFFNFVNIDKQITILPHTFIDTHLTGKYLTHISPHEHYSECGCPSLNVLRIDNIEQFNTIEMINAHFGDAKIVFRYIKKRNDSVHDSEHDDDQASIILRHNIPSRMMILRRDWMKEVVLTPCHLATQFMFFSNNMIEPIMYSDITQMRYIKTYIHNTLNPNLKFVYMIYYLNNIILIYNSHAVIRDEIHIVNQWNKKTKMFEVHNRIRANITVNIDFEQIIGKYKYSLFLSCENS